MLLALALYAQGKTKQALSTLGPILAQAEPEGYLRLFADEGEAMAHLLTLIAPFTTASPDYLQRIFAGSQAAGIVMGGRVPMVLTSRADDRWEHVASWALALLIASRHRPVCRQANGSSKHIDVHLRHAILAARCRLGWLLGPHVK